MILMHLLDSDRYSVNRNQSDSKAKVHIAQFLDLLRIRLKSIGK